MKPTKAIAGILSTGALVFGGVDASVLNEQPIERIETIAENRVEAKQVGNVVETTLPWKDQAGIKVKYDLGEPTAAEKFKDKRKQEVVTELVDFGDGSMKVDILLNEKPDTNVFCYAIEGAENYDFFFQPPLTEQEKAEGANRPPEIEGSYAVYHKTLKNHVIGQENYATGKVMHIPRPQVWEIGNEESTKQWADLSYENGQLCVTAPQDFLDKADYTNGVRIDPTFGYTTAGGSSEYICADASNVAWRKGNPYTAAMNAALNSLSVYLSVSADGSADVATFVNEKDSVAANSHGQIATKISLGLAITTTPTWYSPAFASETATSGTSYVLNVVCDGADVSAGMAEVRLYYDAVAIVYYADGPTLGGWGALSVESPWASGADAGDRQQSIYATYTATGSTTPEVTTATGTQVQAQTATLNGSIVFDGNSTITEHGFAIGMLSTLSGGDTATSTLGTGVEGAFSEVRTWLNPETTYYFRAYGTNASGTDTGDIYSFTTGFAPAIRLNNGTIRINNGKLDI